MNYRDIVDAMHELRKEDYQPKKLIINERQKNDLLANVNMEKTPATAKRGGSHIGTIAGADVEVDDRKSMAILKDEHGQKAVPVVENSGFIHEGVNGHHLVETIEAVSCIHCDKELDGLDTKEKKRWAHGHFLANGCPE